MFLLQNNFWRKKYLRKKILAQKCVFTFIFCIFIVLFFYAKLILLRQHFFTPKNVHFPPKLIFAK